MKQFSKNLKFLNYFGLNERVIAISLLKLWIHAAE